MGYYLCLAAGCAFGFALAAVLHASADEQRKEDRMDMVRVVRCKNCGLRHSSEYCECRDLEFFCADDEREDGSCHIEK